MEKEFYESELTYMIIGCCYSVYNTLGPGLLESVYEQALIYELNKKGLDVKSQSEVPIAYDGVSLKAPMRLDLLVNDKVIVELKSVEGLKGLHHKQLQTYLRLSGKKVGLLVNFNTENLKDDIHRIVM